MPVRAFRIGCAAGILVPYALSLGTQRISVAAAVGLAFGVAASSFCPSSCSASGGAGSPTSGRSAAWLVGGGLAGIAVIVTAVIGPQPGWGGALLEQPAAVTVPVAFAVMVIGSLATRRRTPQDVARTMVRLHAPEVLLGGSEPREQPTVRRAGATARRPASRHPATRTPRWTLRQRADLPLLHRAS